MHPSITPFIREAWAGFWEESYMKARAKSAPALFRYTLTLRFGGRAGAGSRMEIFNAVRELGAFRMRRDGSAQDVLEIRTALSKSEMEERLKELARARRGFYCRIDESDGARGRTEETP